MEKLLEDLDEIRRECGRKQDALAEKHGIHPSEPPFSSLSMCFNHTTLALEIASQYYQTWGHWVAGRPLAPRERDEIIEENDQRLIAVVKTHLIWSVSAMEYGLKQTAILYPSMFGLSGAKRQYLVGIITALTGKGIIGAEELVQWSALAKLRNCLVHNNGIAEEDVDVTVGKGRIVMSDSLMIQSTKSNTLQSTAWAIHSYATTVDRILDTARAVEQE